MKRSFRIFVLLAVTGLTMVSCGVSGDPGHCYFSLDWEYYNEDYGVYYYEDNNPDVPESDLIEPGLYYDCYPGRYDYYYESEDPDHYYTYTGFYTLVQNPGTPGGFLQDGLDGADTFTDLYLYVYNRKSLPATPPVSELSSHVEENQAIHLLGPQGIPADAIHVHTEHRSRRQTVDKWIITVEEDVRVYRKKVS